MQTIRIPSMSIRMTKKRTEILEVLKSHHGTHSAAAIYGYLPHIDLATIYRNLELFTQAGLIKKLHLAGNEAQYEYQDTPHHHAVCTECERIIHFDTTDTKLAKLVTVEDFNITDFEVTVRGVCRKHTT